MFEISMGRLEETLGGLDVPVDGSALARLARFRDRVEAVFATAAAEFDRAGGWEVEGATSMVAWLRDRGGMSRRQAARVPRTGRRLLELAGVGVAAREGRLSSGQVQAIVGTVTDRTVAVFAGQEDELIGVLADLAPSDTAVALGQWQARAETMVGADHRDPEPGPRRVLFHSQTLDNRWEAPGASTPKPGPWSTRRSP